MGALSVATPILITVLAIVPQTLLVLYAPLGLIGARMPIRRVIVPTLIIALVVAVTRSIPALIGWHIFIFLAAYIVVVRAFRLATLLGALAAASLSFILVALSDILVIAPALAIWRIGYEDIVDSPWMHIGFGWLESIIPLFAAILVKWKSFVLIPISRSRIDLPERRSLH